MKRYGYIMVTGLLFVILISFTSLTVIGKQSKKIEINDEYHQMLKKEYVEKLREKMTSMGYRNAGITMNEVVDAEGNRTYTVSIHHKRIDKMEENKQKELLDELQEVPFGDDNCMIIQKILRYNL